MLRLRTKRGLPDIEISRKESRSSAASGVSAPDADAMSEMSVGAAAGGSEESSFLVIHVHEARNLVAKDYEANSSHP
jgi:hypothetical protein